VQFPRVHCPECRRPTATRPIAERPGKGRLWRHDRPGERVKYQGALVSCRSSGADVDLPNMGHQLEIGEDGDEVTGAPEPMLF